MQSALCCIWDASGSSTGPYRSRSSTRGQLLLHAGSRWWWWRRMVTSWDEFMTPSSSSSSPASSYSSSYGARHLDIILIFVIVSFRLFAVVDTQLFSASKNSSDDTQPSILYQQSMHPPSILLWTKLRVCACMTVWLYKCCNVICSVLQLPFAVCLIHFSNVVVLITVASAWIIWLHGELTSNHLRFFRVVWRHMEISDSCTQWHGDTDIELHRNRHTTTA